MADVFTGPDFTIAEIFTDATSSGLGVAAPISGTSLLSDDPRGRRRPADAIGGKPSRSGFRIKAHPRAAAG